MRTDIELVGIRGWMRIMWVKSVGIPLVKIFGRRETCGCVTLLGRTVIGNVECIARETELDLRN